MSFRDEMDQSSARRPGQKHLKGWEPGVTDTGDEVEFSVVRDSKQPPEWRKVLSDEGYDPDVFMISPAGIQTRKWQQREGGDFLYYYKFTVWRSEGMDSYDLKKYLARAKKRKPRKGGTDAEPIEGAALVVNLADWQAGADHGGGPVPLADRLAELGPAVKKRWKELKRIGVPLETIYVHSMGDMGEGCSGFYGQQTYRIMLNHEEQREFLIEMTDFLLDDWAMVAPRVSCKIVPGNHGENRQDGKSFTDSRDNMDVGYWTAIKYAFSKNPERYGHVDFHTPMDQGLDLTYSHDGFITALAHGHQAGRGAGDTRKKLDNWWVGQMRGQRPAGDADLLVTAHFHHFEAMQLGKRSHFMCPALCGYQDYFAETMGLDSPPGTLTYVVQGSGWSHLQVL